MIKFDRNNCKVLYLDLEIKCIKVGLGVIRFSNSMCERDLGIQLIICLVGVNSNVVVKKVDGFGGCIYRSNVLE